MELSFEVQGNPAPWTVWPRRGKPPTGYQRMQAWQAQIQLAARLAWGTRDPLAGPVNLQFAFLLPPKKGRDKEPDVLNLAKAAEDALQGIIIENDRQTVSIEAAKRRIPADEGLTVIWIQEVESASQTDQ